MKRRNVLLLGLIFLAFSIFGFVFTYVYSNTVVYSLSGKLYLAESSAHSYPVIVRSGDTIAVSGNSTNPIDVIILGVVPKEVVSGESNFKVSSTCIANGEVYVMFRTLPYTNLTKINFTIKVYNSFFSGIGYVASSFVFLISLFILGYYILLRKRR